MAFGIVCMIPWEDTHTQPLLSFGSNYAKLLGIFSDLIKVIEQPTSQRKKTRITGSTDYGNNITFNKH